SEPFALTCAAERARIGAAGECPAPARPEPRRHRSRRPPIRDAPPMRASRRSPAASAAPTSGGSGPRACRPAPAAPARGGQRAALLVDLHPVEAGRVLAEDAALRALRERRIAELLLQRRRDLQVLERVDQPLRRAPPDGVRAPEDVPGAEGLQELSDEVGG